MLAALLLAVIIWKILKGLLGFFVRTPEVANIPITAATQAGHSLEELSLLIR
jgi:hypothetical protein